MKRLHIVSLAVFSSLLFAATSTAQSIVGTYELVSRKLPDGKVVTPPAIVGLMNVTSDRINFNISAGAGAGTKGTYSTISSYKLTATEFTETRLLTVAIEEGKAPLVDQMPRTDSAKVKSGSGRVEYRVIPFHGEGPILVFDAKGLVATKAGEFVDTWERRK